MLKERLKKILITTICSIMAVGMLTTPALAADEADKKDDKKKDEIDYTLDKEVQDWLNEGNSIPGDAKFATLKCTSHMWEIDSNDISDGKVVLTAFTKSTGGAVVVPAEVNGRKVVSLQGTFNGCKKITSVSVKKNTSR